MPTTLKNASATLTTTLTTTIYTAPTTATNTARVEHIIISNGATAGTVTLSIFDSSANTTIELLNGFAIAANGVLEVANIILESSDQIRAGHTGATGSKIYLGIVENT